jgi:CubicO group peptidase (beta-lactamase class C family)
VNRGDADPERAAPNITDTTPENQARTFRNQNQVWPVRVIRRGDAVRPLPPHARLLADLTFEVGGVRLSLSDYMVRRRTAGLLILKHGEIALERYGMGNGPESRWTSFSTAKSITATLVGAALHDGAIGSLDDRCELYLPRLRLGLRGRHDPQCPADVLRRGLARGKRCRRTLRGLSPEQGHGEPTARLRPRPPVQTAERSAAGRRL